MMDKDPFAILGLPYGAPMQEVRKRYKEMANYYHPDKNPGDQKAAEKMKDINQAYTAIKSHDYYSEQHYYPPKPPAPQPQPQSEYTPPYGGGASAATAAGQQGGMPNGFYDAQGQYHYYDPNQGASEADQKKAWEDAVYKDQMEQEKKLRKKQIIHNLATRFVPVILAAIILIVAITILHNRNTQKAIHQAVNAPTTSQNLCMEAPQNVVPSGLLFPES